MSNFSSSFYPHISGTLLTSGRARAKVKGQRSADEDGTDGHEPTGVWHVAHPRQSHKGQSHARKLLLKPLASERGKAYQV